MMFDFEILATRMVRESISVASDYQIPTNACGSHRQRMQGCERKAGPGLCSLWPGRTPAGSISQTLSSGLSRQEALDGGWRVERREQPGYFFLLSQPPEIHLQQQLSLPQLPQPQTGSL